MTHADFRVELPGGGHALFTGRADGNLSSVAGERSEDAGEARERLRTHIGVEKLAPAYQVHGAVVARLEGPPDPGSERRHADGQATALSGIGAMVLTADCLPVALGSASAVAMLHAGWRGLAAGVLESGVAAMRELGGEDEIVAVVGPGAGVCCYEVGPEIHAIFGEAHREGARIDLRAIARERLLAAGVAEVRDVRACTICDERFFSHRGEGARAGRQAGVAWRS
ncbi:MAG TPA: polyphenol oxidase family protein [Solirubrobacteraceae bacterium]|jgi:YfiH family protein|nr:polyphenol oxidase family protein [Solirubrobacteraceae bacterium]